MPPQNAPDPWQIGLISTVIGLILGFLGNYLIARTNARNELIRSISNERATAYIALWKLCDGRSIRTTEAQRERARALATWYAEGGGLFLRFKATDHLLGAIKILNEAEQGPIPATQMTVLTDHLSWLRTEMKHAVGSYTRREADRKLPSTRPMPASPTRGDASRCAMPSSPAAEQRQA